ncbi:MAG: sensor histidine kinase [Mangrovibacterium sp.]
MRILPKHSLPENMVYAILWLVVFAVPVFGFRMEGEVLWREVKVAWLKFLPFFVLFLIHNFLLIPFFLLKRKYGQYVVLFLIITGGIVFAGPLLNNRYLPVFPARRPEFHVPGDFPSPRDGRPLVPFPWKEKMPPPEGKRPAVWRPLSHDWLISVLLAGFNVAVCFLFKSIRDEHKLKEMQSQSLQAELNYLKAQINPHFFMNTLNNIHALVDIDTDKAKDTVIELSRIMRYVLYEANRPRVPLWKEVRFLENYIRLMRIRYTDEVEIIQDFPDVIPEVKIPPLLLIPLIENAFKHGISYRVSSFVHSSLEVTENKLTYFVANKRPSSHTSSGHGMGMENLRKRLTLLYESRYDLQVHTDTVQYTVCLTIPIDDDAMHSHRR